MNSTLEERCLEISGIPASISIHLVKTVLKFSGRLDSSDAKACHHLKQPANSKRVIIKLSKRKDVARVMKGWYHFSRLRK